MGANASEMHNEDFRVWKLKEQGSLQAKEKEREKERKDRCKRERQRERERERKMARGCVKYRGSTGDKSGANDSIGAALSVGCQSTS